MHEEKKEILSECNMPKMEVTLPPPPEQKENIISDQMLLGIYGEIMENIRTDRKELDGLLTNFMDMVINEGDSTAGSKEALVNLVKIKSDTSDKMSKIADLMTRIKMKSTDTFPAYLAQKNTINISDSNAKITKKAILRALEREGKEENPK